LIIRRVETIPMKTPFRFQIGSQSRGAFQDIYNLGSPEGAHFFFVKIHTDEDIYGIGDAWAIAPFCEHRFIDDHLGPAILGMDPFDVAKIHDRMRYVEMHLFERLGPMREAQTAVDIALYDIIGKALKKPIYKLIGGAVREVIPPSYAPVPGVSSTIDEMVEAARKQIDLGYMVIKWKVGRDFDMEVERVKALREALGPEVKLHMDPNQGWSPKEAVKTITKMDKYDLYCAEQPVAFWDLKGMAFVRKSVNPIIMADESIGSPRDALNLIRNESCDAFLPYMTKSPGIYYTQKIVTIAEPASIPCWISAGGTIGRVAALHVMATMNNLIYADWWKTTGATCKPRPIGLPFGTTEEFLKEPPKFTSEGVKVPKNPGLGVDLDWEKVEEYRIET
jgi:muconate cycloisomerase